MAYPELPSTPSQESVYMDKSSGNFYMFVDSEWRTLYGMSFDTKYSEYSNKLRTIIQNYSEAGTLTLCDLLGGATPPVIKVRILKALYTLDIHSIKDLCDAPRTMLVGMPSIGKSRMQYIDAGMEKYNLKYRGKL